jgi:hypothetical protein
MAVAMTREQAAAAVAAATAERDGVQVNLLDLDGSFGKRLLAGATLTGETKARWDAAAALLTSLWEIFGAYSAVIDQAALLLTRVRRSSSPELAEITGLLTGPSVALARPPAPLAERRLTDTRQASLAPAVAVREMTRDFARVAEVVTAAESVWNVLAAGLEDLDAQLRQAEQGLAAPAGGADSPAPAGLRAARDELARQRAALNADPLAFWHSGQVDSSHLNLLRREVAGAARQASELAAVRAQAGQRIAAVSSAVAAAQDAVREAAAARARAAEKIAAGSLPPPPPDDVAGLVPRLADLERLRTAGQWTRLAAELDQLEQQAAAARQRFRDAAGAALARLSQRDELRGLLGAYQAKAARLGGGDAGLAQCHDEARALLWTAPCDLTAAAAAVTRYQEAVLALSRPEPRQVSP